MIRFARSIIAQVAVFAILLSLFNTSLTSADTEMALEQVTPNSWMTLDVQLAGKLKQQVSPMLDQLVESAGGDATTDVLVQVLKAGERILISGGMMEGTTPYGFLTFPINDNQWEELSVEGSTETYNDTELYTDTQNNLVFSRLGNLLAAGNISEMTQNAIDLFKNSKTNSLTGNAIYQKVAAKFLPGRFAGLYLNTTGLLDDVEQSGMVQGEELDALSGLFDLYEAIGISGAETGNGYKFNVIVEGNETVMNKEGFSLAPGGSFVPSLYEKFPNAKPIFYTEGYNAKAGWNQTEKLLKNLVESAGENPDDLDKAWTDIKEETGVDIPAIYKTFEKEFGIALQFDSKRPYPYLTILGNVSGKRTEGIRLATTLRSLITRALQEAPDEAYEISTDGDITKINIDITKTEDYDGPLFPIIEITVGVTEDDLFILSNYPDIEQTNKRTGFGADADFAAAYKNTSEALTGLSYLNMRNIWKYADHMMGWAESATGGENGPPLDFYQGYYTALEQLYQWKDLLVTSKGASTSSVTEGTIVFDNVKHKTYAELIEELKARDTDDDGTSDFDERYVYNTPVDDGDRDEDGVNDFEELRIGDNPDGEGRLFNDVKKDAWYAGEVGQTWNSGIVKGYEDDTFRPGNLVTRAEFVAMTVRGFEKDTSSYLGVSIELKKGFNPFSDVDQDAWYLDTVSKAYAQGWIQGKVDQATFQRIFRPGDPITRAEAIQILTQASGALKKSQGQYGGDPMPFKDVSEDKWFYGAVSNAYANDITQGKRPDEFQPLANVTRAEAAALIFRTMNFEIQETSEDTDLGIGVSDLAPLLRTRVLPVTESTPPVVEPRSSSGTTTISSSTTLSAATVDHSLGESNAPIVMEEYSDFQCPYCGLFYQNTLPDIMKNYVKTGKVRLVYKHFPLSFHSQGQLAAEASECGGEQGKFWSMHDKIFEGQAEWANNAEAKKIFAGYAKALDLNTIRFQGCLNAGRFREKVSNDMVEGTRRGVQGTPGFFINGEPLMGTQPYTVFKEAFDVILNRVTFNG